MSRFFHGPYFEQNTGAAGGGSGGAPGVSGTPPAATAPPAGTNAPPAAPPSGTATGTAPPPAVDWEAKYKETNTELEKVRREAAGYRTGNKGQLAEAARALAALAGVEIPGTGQPPDVNTLVQSLIEKDKKRDGEMRQLKIDSALTEIFVKHGVKPKLTRSVLEAEGVLAGLDPNDTEFTKVLNAAVKKAAEDEPALKAAPVTAPPKKSGPEFPGGNGTPPQLTREEVAAMKPEDVVKARKAGQLDQLMGRKPT